MSELEIDPEIIEATRRLFRNHRPTVEGVPTDIGSPDASRRYQAYDLGWAALDAIDSAGLPTTDIKLREAVEQAARAGLKMQTQLLIGGVKKPTSSIIDQQG